MNIVAPCDVLAKQARSALVAARPDGRPDTLKEGISTLRSIEERLRSSLIVPTLEDPAAAQERLVLLRQVRERLYELSGLDPSGRMEILCRIEQSLRAVRQSETPEELLEVGVQELLRACGFSRALFSKVEMAKFSPVLYRSVRELDPVADTFPNWVETAEFMLRHGQLEAELVRRRIPAFVPNTANDDHMIRELVEEGQTASYVVTPIIVGGQPRGLIHADVVGQDRSLTIDDRNNLWTFASHFGFMHERMTLLLRLHKQRKEIGSQLREMEAMFDEFWDGEYTLADPTPSGEQAPVSRGHESRSARLDGLLTPREFDVLELVMQGCTNAGISERLVVSEGTVKSHMTHILRKLGAKSRSGAVAKYLQLTADAQAATA